MEAVNEDGEVAGSVGMKWREKRESGELQYRSGSEALRKEPGGISSAVAERPREVVAMMMTMHSEGRS